MQVLSRDADILKGNDGMKKILVVDNHPVMLKFMSNLLEKNGYQVLTASDGLSALEILKTYIPDVMFIDLVMPNISGDKLCRIIRSMPQIKDAYLIIISATFAEKKVDFTELGANAYIAKGPFNKMSEHVLDVLDRLDKKASNDMAQKIIGLEDVYPREITKELLSSKRHSETILDNISEGVLELTIEGKIIYANPVTIALIGIPEEKLLGSNFTALFDDPHQMRVKELLDLIDDGPQKISEDLPVILKGKQVSLNILPINDDERKSVIVILSDISKRKQIEDRLRRAQKMEAIGTLAGGLAHDFNNLLSIITGNIELAKDDVKPEYGVTDFLNEAEEASLRATELANQLITFSKGGTPVKKTGSIGEIVRETTNLTLSDSNIKCDFLISQDLWPVEFDQDQMKHAINNIIINAAESMPDGASINIKADNFNITAEHNLPLSEGKCVKISIRDHGVGIPEKHLSKIFDPYFSTKEKGIEKGMGLGLAITCSIINKHDGHITVESKVEVGTTFSIYLPAHVKGIKELKPTEIHKPEKPSISTKRILLMDDEEGIRRLSKQRLGRLGYEPELAKDGAQAIEIYKKAMDSGQPFDAVILDLTVKGGMGGKDTVKALLKLDPQVKAIVSSGYSDDPVMTYYESYGFARALVKPYAKEDLNDVLNKVIKG